MKLYAVIGKTKNQKSYRLYEQGYETRKGAEDYIKENENIFVNVRFEIIEYDFDDNDILKYSYKELI